MTGGRRREAETRKPLRLSPEVRRSQILAAAMTLFEERDPQDVTFEEIADAAGVSRGLVHNYFGDRGGLLAAVYLDVFSRLDEALGAAVDGLVGREARTEARIRCYVNFARANQGGWRILPVLRAAEHPKVREARLRRSDEMGAGWGDGADARIAALAVTAMVEAATKDWLERGGLDEDRMGDVLFRLVWMGMQGTLLDLTPAPAAS